MISVVIKVEHVEQVTEGRAVEWHVRIVIVGDGVGEVVPAPMSQRSQAPVSLNELKDRHVIRIRMVDVASLGEGRDND